MARRKTHRLRRLVSGDISALDDGAEGSMGGALSSSQESMMQPYYRADTDPLIFYDILVQDIEEGRSNKLFTGVRTLIFQTANTFPQIEFSGLTSKLGTINSLYCAERMKRCAARHNVRLALADYIISGLGCTMVCLKDDYPTVMWLNILDVCWDLTAKLPTDIKWGAVRFTQPLRVWLDLYSDGRKYNTSWLKEQVTSGREDIGMDRPVSLWWYFDTEGKQGTHAVYPAMGEEIDDTAIYVGSNPYEMAPNEPMLPFEFMGSLPLPGVKMPPSIVEMMVPAQIAIWNADSYVREVLEKGKPFYEMQDDGYDPKNVASWLDSVVGTVLRRKKNAEGIRVLPAMELSNTVMRYREQNDSELTAQSGSSPYTNGDRVEGVEYAAEVQAIQGNSGLVAGALAKDQAEYWQRLASKFLAVGAKFDDMPCALQFDEDVLLSFDKQNPIREYLKPDAEVTVEEDTLQFQPKLQRIQQSTSLLGLFSAPEMVQRWPNAQKRAAESVLKSAGIKNIDDWLQEAAPPAAVPGMVPGMAPGGAPTPPPQVSGQGGGTMAGVAANAIQGLGNS